MRPSGRDAHYSVLLEKFVRLSEEKQFLFHRIEALLPDRRDRYLDVGPGDGKLMGLLAPFFGHSTAIEVNGAFEPLLRRCADEVISQRIEDAAIPGTFTFILACHVLGYVAPAERAALVRRLLRHLDADGVLVVVFNSVNSEVFRILERLAPYGGRCWAAPVRLGSPEELLAGAPGCVAVKRDSLQVTTTTDSEAEDIVEFMAFGDTPLSVEGREVLRGLVASYHAEDGLWHIDIEHEFVVMAHSSDVILTRRLPYDSVRIAAPGKEAG